MFKLLIIFSLTVTALASPLNYEGKIVGGTEAALNEIPWQAEIQIEVFSGSISHLCGGSIINSEWIVTAAQCVPSEISRSLQVRVGSLDFAFGGSVHKILNVTTHPNYNSSTMDNDISLWRVETPFVWDNSTQPIALRPQGSISPANTITTVSGWGRTSETGSYSAKLLKVDVSIIERDQCNIPYNNTVTINQICAGDLINGNKNSCQGDAGGPLFTNGELWGIVSWGYACDEAQYPGVYTDAAVYTDWITQITGAI